MSLVDSPAVVALITVIGSLASTLGAVLLNRRANSNSDMDLVRSLLKQIEDRDKAIKKLDE